MRTRLRRNRTLLRGSAISVLAGVLAVIASLSTISLVPPTVKARQLQVSAAATHVFVKLPSKATPSRRATESDFDSLAKRTTLIGQLMASAPVRERIGRIVGVDPGSIAAVAQITGNVPATLREPDSEQRAHDIATSRRRYRLDIQSKPAIPVLDVYTQAPSPDEATALANAAIRAMRDELAARADAAGLDRDQLVVLEQIGSPRAAVINSGDPIQIAALTFFVVVALTGAALAAHAATPRRPAATRETTHEDGGGEHAAPAAATRAPARRGADGRPAMRPSLAYAASVALPAPPARWLPSVGVLVPTAAVKRVLGEAHTLDAWPRTTRILPWMLAGFMAVLWLVPFNQIDLSVSTPIDLKFDRLILPFLMGAWVLSLALGGTRAPRLRWTIVHVGVLAFVALAFLSVVFTAPYLSQTLELDLAIKKLTLLVAYVSLFVIVASTVRRVEIPAFLTYTLVLAVICGLGTIWEYRFQYNVFYDLSDKLLPGLFNVGVAESGAVDEIGRRLVRGPAELGLEAVAMLTMGLPIAIVRMMDAARARERLVYGLAACILLAAAIATFRKSAFLAPISVVATLAYFRRDYILKLLPLGLLLLAMIPVLSPGALGSVVTQLDSNRLGVATVSDRTADYDALRPDLWSHFLFGKGFGTYDHTSYRILDSEILSRIAEMGVLGLAAYILMALGVVAGARRLIRTTDRGQAQVALAAASAAIGFIVLSSLFDVLAFPHVPYLFLTWAGLLAVAIKSPDEAPP